MSKLADALRALKVYNNHGLLTRFGAGKDVCVEYSSGAGQRMGVNKTQVWSPRFKTDPDAHWQDYGCKTFVGNRAKSFDKALAWAIEQYGSTEWAVSPFGGRIPKRVLDAAKKAVKETAK